MGLEESEIIQNPELIMRMSREKILSDTGEDFTDPKEIGLWKCLQRLAKLSVVEGLALSRIKGYNEGIYSTIIAKWMIPNTDETHHFFEESGQALGDFGEALGECIPGSIIMLPEGRAFYKAARSLRGKRRASELELLGIIHFIK